MRKISSKKREFLESIGVDLENLPSEFEKICIGMIGMSDEEIKFLYNNNLKIDFNRKFCLKDLVGTKHENYFDVSWIDFFIASKRGDEAVEKYFENPNYYFNDLKKKDQSNLQHTTPLQLYEKNGKLFIRGGNNRLSLIMMKYLAEISRAKSEEEKEKINEKYTFVGRIASVPKDKELIHLLNLLSSKYPDAIIKKITQNPEDCKFRIQIEDFVKIVRDKKELKTLLKMERVRY